MSGREVSGSGAELNPQRVKPRAASERVGDSIRETDRQEPVPSEVPSGDAEDIPLQQAANRSVPESEGAREASPADNPAPLSSALHLPTLVKDRRGAVDSHVEPDNPAPLSSAIGLPTLAKEPPRGDDRVFADKPAPFSSFFGIPVLIKEKPSRLTTPHGDDAASRGLLASTRAENFGSASSAFAGSPLELFSFLDRAAAGVAALMILGPLFVGAFGGAQM